MFKLNTPCCRHRVVRDWCGLSRDAYFLACQERDQAQLFGIAYINLVFTYSAIHEIA